jgi:hypothetical protein
MLPHPLTAEDVAYWFFRLNGCLTINNFVLHPSETRGNTLSDVDLVAVRFPHRTELEDSARGGMPDHPLVLSTTGLVKVILAEVKTGLGRLNTAWSRENSPVWVEILKRIGMFPIHQVDEIASHLKEKGNYVGQGYEVSITIVCDSPDISDQNGAAIYSCLTWQDAILPFIHQRLRDYRRYKSHHSQWDNAGRRLYELAGEYRDKDHFIREIINEFNQRGTHHGR